MKVWIFGPGDFEVAKIDPLALETWLKEASGSNSITVISISKLKGGALQENWLVNIVAKDGLLKGKRELVLRTNSTCGIIQCLSREAEFQVLRAVHAAGLLVPEPYFLDSEGSRLGMPSYLMSKIEGTAHPRHITQKLYMGETRAKLTQEIGAQLAKIHRIQPHKKDLPFLPIPRENHTQTRITLLTNALGCLPAPFPVLEWGLHWLCENAPTSQNIALCHGDYRIGNIMVKDGKLSGILDWEFASWGDPLEDIGWLCARCWRFGVDHFEAGGIGDRRDFYTGYETEMGHQQDWSNVPFWEIIATIRWAIIAHHQGLRSDSSAERALELILTERKAAELELEMLQQIKLVEEKTNAK